MLPLVGINFGTLKTQKVGMISDVCGFFPLSKPINHPWMYIRVEIS